MTTTAEWRPERQPPTYSFYLTAHMCKTQPEIVRAATELADAITIAGPKGPENAKRLRDAGLEGPFLFDGMGYKGDNLYEPRTWVQQQSRVGAARLLLPGVFIPWEKDSEAALADIFKEQGRIADHLGAIILAAVDVRWVARKTDLVVDSLLSTGQPVALVLAHRADPLSVGGAVPGLRRVSSKVEHLFHLRSDHGSIGAVAFGAEHASIGLTTTTRHYATTDMRPRRRPGPSARLFVHFWLDWFLASDIAAWAAAGRHIVCPLPCCGGGSLSRYFDEDQDATFHNLNALAAFTEHVLGAESADRATEFLNACQDATLEYGLAGLEGPKDPKAQLTSWMFS